ncbi:MAG: hypothetical protein LBN30_05195 [Oscillospiraceae bacterium]|jgi:hypothetical protein|nr:hypothetical protein [Oscillospiraceae bacterium]
MEAVQLAYRIVALTALFTLALTQEHRVGAKTRRAIEAVHNAAFYIYLSHPLALFAVTRFIPSGAMMITRFLLRALAGYVPPTLLGIAYISTKKTALKNRLGANKL